MKVSFPAWRTYSFISILAIIISCGGNDITENIVENYVSGNIKISTRYFPDVNVIEKKFYSEAGEMIHLEQDSLQYPTPFKNYLLGNWIMDKMVVNDEIVFEIEKYNTTVLLTSISGYSDFFDQDTLKAFELLKIQKNILLPIIEDHNGISLLNIMDHKLIITFNDAKEGVECAMAIHAAVKENKKLTYHMGIHKGELFKKNDEVFGHDINIAEGMRYISVFGGIVISNKVYETIKENKEIETMPLDIRYFRSQVGLDQAIRPYCIISNELPEPANIPEEIFLSVYKKSALELKIPPNLYEFLSKKLIISGPQYQADYKISYFDSSQVEVQGQWAYGNEGDDNYRTRRVYNKYYFQAISYNSFQWKSFLNDPEKEEEVLFRRVIMPKIEIESDTTLIKQ